MADYKNSFYLKLKTSKPVSGEITTAAYYKDNLTPIAISVTGAKLMKVWINQTATGTKSDPEIPENWVACSAENSWTPNFTVEGTNYIHAIFDDGLGNETDVVNSVSTIFDKTAPKITDVEIASGAEIVAVRTVDVKVTASDLVSGVDAVSGIKNVVLSGDLDASSPKTFLWGADEEAAGYIICKDVVLSENVDGEVRGNKTINAIATDNAGNTGEQKSASIVLYTGGIDPVMVMKDGNSVIGGHYGKNKFDLKLEMLNGDPEILNAIKVWGDFSTTEGSETGISEDDAEWIDWGTETSKLIENLYLTVPDSIKTVSGKGKFVLGDVTTVETKADLPVDDVSEGAKYIVNTDETKENKKTSYIYLSATWVFYGYVEGTGSDQVAIKDLDAVKTHHAKTGPNIEVTSDVTAISDKEGYNVATLTVTFTTSEFCKTNEYKVVAYEDEEAAQDGTYEDPSNIDLYSTTPITSGGTWEAEVLASKLLTAISGDGSRKLVVYAKNECGIWTKSDLVSILVDTTGPVGNISVDAFYNMPKGIAASATDAGTSVVKMTCWADTSAETTTPPETASEIDYHTNPTDVQIDWTGIILSTTPQTTYHQGDFYFHIVYKDAVGNTTLVTSAKTVFDNIPPTGVSITIPAVTNSRNLVATLTATDTLSGVNEVKVYGDVTGSQEFVPFTSSVNIELTASDGEKTVKIVVKDKAGNVSEEATATTLLDTTAPSPAITLWNNDDTAQLGPIVGVRDIRVHIGVTNIEDLSNIIEYQIWGDIEGHSTDPTPTGEWLPYSPDAGKTYKSQAVQLTSAQGSKMVTVRMKDSAGNFSTGSATVTLNTNAPVINILDLDYSVISLSKNPRYTDAGGQIPNTYAKMMTFKFSSDMTLSEFKVCVYDASKTAATAVAITEDDVEKSESGEVIFRYTTNMSGNHVDATVPVSCSIGAVDFKNHPVIDAQGASEEKIGTVIVLGKSEGGIWSSYTPEYYNSSTF